VVVIDVLSFSTSATVAVGKGTVVYPHRWPDPDIDAFAAAHDAVRAARRHEVTADHPWSLSPSHLLAAPAAARLVLPSPNGSTIAATMDAEGAGVLVAGCLRNASAVGRWLAGKGFGSTERPVAIVAAGEKWPTGELRPAVEDLLGAGAIIEALGLSNGVGPGAFSAEAEAAAAVWRGQRHHLAETLNRSSTGRQLTEAGHAADIEVAAQFDAQDTVPVLADRAFQNSNLH
jgi:2-phosphosulfolactate phosphatase